MEPTPAAYVFISHLLQEDTDVAPVTFEIDPGGQPVHTPCPAPLYVLGPQILHAVDPAGENEPAGQAGHELAPLADDAVPDGQSIHPDPRVEYWPGPQEAQAYESVLPGGEPVPAEHQLQDHVDCPPTEEEYVPDGHNVQAEAPVISE